MNSFPILYNVELAELRADAVVTASAGRISPGDISIAHGTENALETVTLELASRALMLCPVERAL